SRRRAQWFQLPPLGSRLTPNASAGHMSRPTQDRWIIAIAIFKLVKGLLLVAAGIGALRLLHKDVGEVVQRWIEVLRVDPDNQYVHHLLVAVLAVDDRML